MKPLNSSSPVNRLMLYVRSGIVQFNLLFSTIVICPFMLVSVMAPFSLRYRLSQWWVRFNLWSVETFCGLHYHVDGIENIPIEGNAIILCKHQSTWETLALQNIFPPQVFLLKRELLWLPFWGWAMATLKPVAINRKTNKIALRNLLEQGKARLKEGLWIVIFPEGTRTAPGKKKKFNAGGCLLAEQSGYPVIPVAHNAGEFWPRYGFLKYPGTIQVKIGPVIDSKGRKAHELNQEVKDWINQQMQDISSVN